METIIRPWRLGDANQISAMIRAFMVEEWKNGSDVLPTLRNVKFFWKYGLAQALAGEPTLVVQEKNKLIAYCQAGPWQENLDLAYKTLFLYGLYTLPSKRSQHWSLLLLREVGAQLPKLGYQRAKSQVQMANRKMLAIAFSGDIWPLNVGLYWNTELIDHVYDRKIDRKAEIDVVD